MRKTILKYKIMRIRIKISYYAFMKNQTVAELIMNQIISTYNTLNGYPFEFLDKKIREEFE